MIYDNTLAYQSDDERYREARFQGCQGFISGDTGQVSSDRHDLNNHDDILIGGCEFCRNCPDQFQDRLLEVALMGEVLQY